MRFLRWSCGVLFAILFLNNSLVFAESFSLQLDPRELQKKELRGQFQSQFDSEQADSVARFLKDVEDRIPPFMKEALGRKFFVRFKTFPNVQVLPTPICKGRDSENFPRRDGSLISTDYKGLITLNQLFIPEIIKGDSSEKKFECQHSNYYREAMATLIHQLAHIYDFSKSKGAISGTHDYRSLAGWKKERSILSGWMSRLYSENHSVDRVPDPAELHSVDEHFAVNMEYFLLDSDYRCRRPTLNQYLVDHFTFAPESSCKYNTKVPVYSSFGNLNLSEPRLVDLNPSRVYQIHFFPASEGADMSSRWGHAMLRIVLCSPDRKEVNEECLKDLDHHLVVSYRAGVHDPMIDAWKGLTGQYESLVLLINLMEVKEHYTGVDLRDLRSLPLNLSLEETQRFVFRILEQFWGYRGDYYFISNNCNSESIRVLKAIGRQREFKTIGAFTPAQLEKQLIEKGLANGKVFEDTKKAIREGYLFKSAENHLDQAFGVLRAAILEGEILTSLFPWKSTNDYLENSRAKEREAIFPYLKKGAGAEKFQALLDLEEIILLKLEQKLNDEIILGLHDVYKASLNRLDVKNGSPQDFQKESLHALLATIYEREIPNLAHIPGYGIPTEREMENLDPGLSPQQMEKFLHWSQEAFKGLQGEITRSRKVLDHLRSEISNSKGL